MVETRDEVRRRKYKKFILPILLVVLFLAGFFLWTTNSQLSWRDFGFYQEQPQNGILDGGEQDDIVGPLNVVDIVDQALPSVVTITIRTTVTTPGDIRINPFDPFGFEQVPGEEEDIERNIGSGFIVSSGGLVITNKHVVSDPEAEYDVLTADENVYEVQQIYRDPLNDLAILQISPVVALDPLELGDSSEIQLGQTAVAIGTPLGEFTNTVTAGIISGIGRGITAGSPYEQFVEQLDDVIQTDAAISPGNSGGPLLNDRGQVIGVNTAVAAQGQNLGFAIPSNVVRELLDSFEARGGTFERPYIGVRYQMLTERAAELNDLPVGAYIVDVVEGSPAEDAGLQEDDIILSVDGTQIQGDEEVLTQTILERDIGDTITLEVWRDGDTSAVQLELEGTSE